uniref:GRIP domain-containing protein n=1 Tax=Glossina pallidipes TaxID=7398 RepID=A0A1A9ZIF8_GLOPL
PTENHGSSTLEDSWCWEPDNSKSPDNDRSSETSSGNSHEMVNITLEEIPLGASAKSSKARCHRLGTGTTIQNAEQHKRLQHLEEENKQLQMSLEELDSQHNLAMQNVLELKANLQEQLSNINNNYEGLNKDYQEQLTSSELEIGKLRETVERLEGEKQMALNDKSELGERLKNCELALKESVTGMSDLQKLLDKKSNDNVELIERIRESEEKCKKTMDDHGKLLKKFNDLSKEFEEFKMNDKKTSGSSASSSEKQSEDEFIVVREGGDNSPDPATPPTKEELKDKIVQLENKVSSLLSENESLTFKIQDQQRATDCTSNKLIEKLKAKDEENENLAEELRMLAIDNEEKQEQLVSLEVKMAESVSAYETLDEQKSKICNELQQIKETFSQQNHLLEAENKSLQNELQNLKISQARINELEQRLQAMTLENQQLKLNAEAITETSFNLNEDMEEKLKLLSEENANLKSEILRITDSNFKRAIAEEKQTITDLDEDEEEQEDELDLLYDKCKNILKAQNSIGEPALEEMQKLYNTLRGKLAKAHDIEKNLTRVSDEILDLQDSKLVWDHEKKTLEADISQYILQCDELMKNNEILLNELENYKRHKLETISENNEENIVQLETQLEECNKLNLTLEQEYNELHRRIEELEKEKQQLNEKLRETQIRNEKFMIKEKDLNLQIETLELEKCNILLELNDIKMNTDKGSEHQSTLPECEEKCHDLEKQLSALAKDHADLVIALQTQKVAFVDAIKKHEQTFAEKQLLENQCKQMQKTLFDNQEESKRELMAKDIVIESLKQDAISWARENEILTSDKRSLNDKIDELDQQLLASADKEQILNSQIEVLSKQQICPEELDRLQAEKRKIEDQFSNLEQELKNSKTEIQMLKEMSIAHSLGDVNQAISHAEQDAKLLDTADMQKNLETLAFEKQEFIKALQQKHSENMRYYMEIQRLTIALQKVQQRQQENESKSCDKCPALEATANELKREQEKLKDQINFLKEKSDILTTNLLTEQTNQKLMQQEKNDVLEQNATLRKDLERLRAHLLEIEDMHTQETMEMQNELETTKERMSTLEQEVSKSNNAYTSASIRANQHAETLQAQYALLVQQRDELVAKLSLAEDRESKNQAALTNLQCALEQFQNDKENDIKLATQRLRKELQQHFDKENELQAEMQQLQQQLAEANQGLRAASRLSDQLEASQQTVAVLREEVDALKQHTAKLEEKLSSTESSQTDKIEKSLIKSLFIGYVVSGNPNDKHQILRMISSLLGFTQNETDKVGLNKQTSGWLGSILGGGGGGGVAVGGGGGAGAGAGGGASHSKENLMQAFVQFLEQESRPKTNAQQMPNLLNITTSSSSRRTSSSSNPVSAINTSPTSVSSPAPVPIQASLLNSNVIDDFTPTRNSSSILKDILSDS